MNYSLVAKEFIFGEERPFESCHASTLVALPGGDVLVAWFGGSQEGANDVGIWYSRRREGLWDAPTRLQSQEAIPHWNPVLFQDDEGVIYLFFKVGFKIPEWSTMLTLSLDGGCTWSEPMPLVEGDRGGRGPVKNKPIRLESGAWLAPASVEGEYWDAFADASMDQGKSWIPSGMVPIDHESLHGKGIIQPTLWESTPGKVHMLLRSTEGRIYRSDSDDSGANWSPAYASSLPNNNSGIDLVKLDGELALVHNPVEKNWGPRTPLVISSSSDGGQTWQQQLILEDTAGEYSYPAIIAHEDQFLVCYTWNRERIVFAKIAVTSNAI